MNDLRDHLAWAHFLGMVNDALLRIETDEREGKVTKTEAYVAQMWIRRLVAIPEMAMASSRDVMERAAEEEALSDEPIDLEDETPTDLMSGRLMGRA